MLVNHEILEDLYKDAGEGRKKRAIEYQKQERVRIKNVDYEDSMNFSLSANVIGNEIYKTYISIKNGMVEDVTCTCEDYYNHYGICKHTLATVLEFINNPQYIEQYVEKDSKNEEKLDNNHNIFNTTKLEPQAYRNFKQIVNSFYQEEVEGIADEEDEIKQKGTIKIEPIIYYEKFSGDIKVEFKIGNKKMYKIKNLADFYTRMLNKENYKYGQKLEFVHTRDAFAEESKPLLDFILKYAEIIKYANSNSNSNFRYYGKALNETNILVGNTGIDDLFEVLKGKEVEFNKDYSVDKIEFTEEEPKLDFILKKNKEGNFVIYPDKEIYEITILRGKLYKYIITDKKLYRCSKEFERTSLKLLELFRQNYVTEIEFGEEELTEFFSVVLPKVKDAIKIEGLTEEEIEKYKPKELVVKVFLDFDKNDYLVADVRFCYEENEFNPLNENEKINFPRNMIKETKALNVFRKTGFMLDVKNTRFILPNDDKIYEFLTEDINYYMQKFAVMVTENFKKKQIRSPKMTGLGVKVENDLLTIDLSKIDIDSSELQDIMEKYSLKKKYYRLKDGSFINLEDNKEIEFLDKLKTGMGVDYKELEDGELRLPVNRTLYLNQLLKGIKGTEILKNLSENEYATISEDDTTEDTTTENTTTEENTTEENTTGENATGEDVAEESAENTTTSDEESTESEEETETTQKEITLSISGNDIITTSFDTPITDGIIDLSMNSATTDTDSISEYMQSTTTIAILLNNGALPLTYTVTENQYVETDISMDVITNVIIVVAVIFVILLIYMAISKKSRGLLAALSFIGFTALYLLLIRYTNVVISLESIVGGILVLFINYVFSLKLLKIDTENKKLVYLKLFSKN